jgi:hypothetical protein
MTVVLTVSQIPRFQKVSLTAGFLVGALSIERGETMRGLTLIKKYAIIFSQ